MAHKIEKIWVFTTECEDLGEGICAVMQDNKYMPLVCTSKDNLDFMIETASEMSHDLGVIVTVNEFSNKKVLQVLKPVEH